jgi:hypothetical protein
VPTHQKAILSEKSKRDDPTKNYSSSQEPQQFVENPNPDSQGYPNSL